MGELLGEIVPLAAAAAISPVVFLVQLSTLIQEAERRAKQAED